MAIVPTQKEENVERSIHKYLFDNFTLVPIAWPGIEFDESGKAAWIQPVLLTSNGLFFRQVGSMLIGKQLIILYNINLFVNRTMQAIHGQIYNIGLLSDTLFQIFKENTQITVKDYVDGSPGFATIGVLDCFETSLHDVESPSNELIQKNFTIEMRGIKSWEAAA